MAISGFGIRQLADLVLLVKKKGNEINWNNFAEKAEKRGLTQFSKGIFNVCNLNIFNKDIKILNYLGKNTLIIMETHQILIEIIGVFTKCERYNRNISFFLFIIIYIYV